MDIFTACKIAACKTPLCVFYGGGEHTQNVARALIATRTLGAVRSSLARRGDFVVEVLTTNIGRCVFLGENHSRTSLATAEKLIRDLKRRCNNPTAVPCTLFLERHRPLAAEQKDSTPNIVACNAKDAIAIQRVRCSDAVETNRCSKLKIEFVDIRHVWMGFFREEIAPHSLEEEIVYKVFFEFQKHSLDAFIDILADGKKKS